MARGRMINQKIVEDIDFNEMSIEAQFLFMRTIPFLDRDGLVWGHPGLLASKIVPLLPDFYAKTGPAIEEWIKAGFVVRYMDGRTPVLFFKGFSKNQSLTHYDREGASSFAPPPGFHRTNKGLRPLDGDDGLPLAPPESPKKTPPSDANNTPEEVRTNSGPSQDDLLLKGKERKGSEVKETGAQESSSNQNPPPLFPLQHRAYRERSKVAEHLNAAKELGLSASQFRQNTDALLAGFGKTALVEAGDDSQLNQAQELTVIMARMAERFRTTEGINSVFTSWKNNDYRGSTTPTPTQYKEHASLILAGKVKKVDATADRWKKAFSDDDLPEYLKQAQAGRTQ